MRQYRRPKPAAATAIGAAVTVVATLPVFLISAMAVQVMQDLAFSSVGLGLAVAAHRSGAAVTSVFLGRLADRLGAIRAIRLSAGIAAIAALGMATTARSLTSLVLWLAFSGSSLTLAQPGANRLLAAIVDPRRLGMAFGLKQSAAPIASMLAGAAVPLIAVTVGWRWGFVLAALAAVLLVVTVKPPPTRPATPSSNGTPRPRLEDRATIVVLAAGFGLGTATSSVTTTFYVASAAASGSSPQFGGVMLAVASLAAIGTRILAGAMSDRIVARHLVLCAVLMGMGSIGIALLATGTEALMAIGVCIALAGVWGFNGVFWFALIRAYPKTPGRITGAVSPGSLMGSTLGPLVFGVIVQFSGYGTAWGLMAGVAVLSASIMLIGNRRLAARQAPA